MAKLITCTVRKVIVNGVGPKKFLANFPAMRGIIESHERLEDAMLFTLINTKWTLVKGKRVTKKTPHYFTISYDAMEGELPFELHGKRVTISSKKIEVV